jgi:lysophospholipase L1-like esterase
MESRSLLWSGNRFMKRFLFWKLPLTASIVAGLIFATGFVLVLLGGVGEPVQERQSAPHTTGAAKRAPGEPLQILLLGDSLARGTGDDSGLGIGGNLEAELKRRSIDPNETVNLAVNGARTADLLKQLESDNVQRLLSEADVIVLSIGGNDLFGGVGYRPSAPEEPEDVMSPVLERVEAVVSKIREANPEGRIFLIGLYNPFRFTPEGERLSALVNRWNAHLIEQFGEDQHLTVVQTSDIFSHRNRLSFDRFHPGREGYQLISRRIAEAL